MSDNMKVIRERGDSSKRAEDSDHKEVLTLTLRSYEEHVLAETKHAVNNMASSFEPNAHPYPAICTQQPIYWVACKSGSAQFAPREYKFCGGKAGEIYRLGNQVEVQIEIVSELTQVTTTTTVYIRDATAVIQMMAERANFVH
jgi:hypothetical protein